MEKVDLNFLYTLRNHLIITEMALDNPYTYGFSKKLSDFISSLDDDLIEIERFGFRK